MSYAGNWPLAQPALLPDLIRSYVRDSVLENQGLSMVSWNRSGSKYAQASYLISSMWGSMVADAGFSIDIPQRMLTSDQKRAYIRNILVPNSRQSDIRRVFRKAREGALDKKKRIFVIFLNSFWWRGGRAAGHAQFIVIDYRRKTQVFFDPHGLNILQQDLDFFSEYCLIEPMVPGHRNIPPQQALGIALQSHMERDLEQEQCGTCGITSLITILIARRFNYWHFPRLTEAIRDAFPSQIDAAVVIHGLVDLYESRVLRLNIQGAPSLEQQEDLFSTLFPPEGRCNVYSDSSGKFCSRKACRQGPSLSLCWQHRHYLQAPYNTSRKCAAPFR